MNSYLISVIIPLYNVEKYIERCLDSVLSQTYDNVEVICVDDFSTDNTIKVVERLSLHNDKIRLIRNKQNSGPGICRSQGCSSAKGDYICFLDADDTFTKDALEVLITVANASKCDIVRGNINLIEINGKNRLLTKDTLPYGDSNNGVYQALLEGVFKHNLVATLFKRELLLNFQYLNYPLMRNGEDGYYFYQVVENIRNGVKLVDKVVYNYFMNNTSSTHIQLSDSSIRGLAVFYDYVTKIRYANPELKTLALFYSTKNMNEFALICGISKVKKQLKEMGIVPFVSFSYRARYMNLIDNARWYVKFILSLLRHE